MYKVMGRTITPVVARSNRFGHEYGLVIIKGLNRFCGKIKAGARMYPNAYKAYYGTVEFYTNDPIPVLNLDGIGKFQTEGMGIVRWIKVERGRPPLPRRGLKIRRCLPKLSERDERFVKALLLHDFVSTPKHQSKIYFDVEIEDERVRWLCKHHHDRIDDPELELLQKYDRWSAMLGRKIRYKTFSRYSLLAKSKIDFEKLKREIEVRQHSAYSLYSFVYNSKELEVIAEATDYGFSSLRRHLLVAVGLYLADRLSP